MSRHVFRHFQLRSPQSLLYSWIALQVYTHRTLIYRRTKSVTTNPKTMYLRKALDEETVDLLSLFLSGTLLASFFKTNLQITSEKWPGRIGLTSSNPLVPRSQIFLRCLGLLEFFYIWIANQRDTHEKLIFWQTRRVTTLSKPQLESSRRGEFRSIRTIFV